MTVSQKLNVGIPSICRPAPNEITSDSVLLWGNSCSFLADDEMGTSVRLHNMHNTPDVDLECARSPAHCAS